MKNNGVKLLAAVMVFAMAFAGAFVMINSDDSYAADAVDADTGEETTKTYFKIGNTPYDGITDALKAVKDGQTIVMTENYSGPGIGLFDKDKEITARSFTIDLGGFIYDAGSPAVGSTGTQTQAVHIESEYTVTIKNGTLTSTEPAKSDVKMIIQNYADLTLDNVIVDGSKGVSYTISNNCGEIHFKGTTNIIATEGEVAFDLYYWPSNSYTDGVQLYFDAGYNGTITGKVELTSDKMGVDDAPKKNKLVVSEGATVTLNGDIDDQADVPIQIYGTLKVSAGNNIDAIFTNTINGVTNNAVVNITAGEKGISITKGSIVISGTIDVAEEATIDAEGTVRIDGAEITGDSELTVTVTEGGKSTVIINNVDVKGVLSISGDVTVTGTMNVTGTVNNEGNMTINGTMNNDGTVANTGTVEFTSSAKYNGGASDNKIQNDDSDNAGIVKIPAGSDLTNIATGGSITTSDGSDIFGMKGELEGDYPVSNAYLSSTLTIPEGKTLTVKGTLDLRGQTLIVKGKLIIESKGVIAGDIKVVDGKVLSNIVLSKTGVIENKGLIGANSFVKVTDEQGIPASVTMKNVTGVEFSLTKETTNYILTVSGNAAKKGTENTFDINNAYISDLTVRDLKDVTFTKASVVKNGSLNIGSKAIVAIGTEMTLLSGAVLTIDGKLTDAKVIMYLGSTANINGVATTPFKAMTGDYATYNDDDGSRYNIDLGNYNEEDEVDYSTITSDNLKGFVIDITSKTYTDDDENSRTVQMMNVSGQSAVADKEATDIKDSITVEGEVYVAKGTELIISKDTSIVTTGVVVTEGTLRIVEVTSGIDNYEGAEYYVKVTPETGSPYTDYIYTDFDSALAVIDTVENKTVTLKGGYTFSKSFTVAAGQEIKFEDMSAGYKISKDATVTVEADGTMSVGFAQKGIMGTLVVKDGATCTPVEGSYEVSSKDANDNYTYTSAASAIENAKAGETIYITSNVEFPENIVIPEGVTVDIANGQTVTAKKDMTVNGKILNNGNISVEQDLAVAGEIENEGNLAITGTTTVTGKVVGDVKCDDINAASYNDDGKKIYTSVANAVEAVSKMDAAEPIDVTGKVSENIDVALVDGMVLNIKGEATLKSINMVVGSKIVISGAGKLTTDIIGATGTEGTTGALSDTTVSVKALEATTFEMKKNESTSTTTMYMDATGTLKGTFTVATGSLEILDAIVASEDVVVKIASGAELVVKNNLGGEAKYFTNEGTLKIAGSMSVTGLELAGTIDVAKNVNLSVSDVTVTGVINTAEGATVKVADGKYMYVGSKLVTLGASTSVKADVTFGTGAYVVVFDGSSFENTSKTEMDSTVYTINGNAFATVYIMDGANVNINVVNSIVNGLKDLDIPYTDANGDKKLDLGEETYEWKSGNTVATTVGQFDSVDAKIDYAGVNVVISVGPGMIVYIDDLKVTLDSKNLLIGEHTVTIYLEPDYTGTATISFNGATVSNGKIVVTADMIGKDPVLVVTGATPAEPTAPITPGTSGSDDGMSITDILLIVLVVLIVIMAILVAIRMMRS